VRLVFTPHGRQDYTYWLAADRATFKRIIRLIEHALPDSTAGIGKPEPRRHLLAGAWSRRISEEHRLVYLVDADDLVVLQARYHYAWLAPNPVGPAEAEVVAAPPMDSTGRASASRRT
jgi:toxin YoeB